MRNQKKKSGFFITFEGGEGSGKSTQILRLVPWLTQNQFRVQVTREPGGTGIGQAIRDLLLYPEHKHFSPRAESLLYQADRAQHVDELLLPALTSGKVVVCDRFFDSSTVYQGICRNLGVKWVETLNLFATGGLSPDLVILLDVPETVGLKRVDARSKSQAKSKDRMDLQAQSFHKKVRRGFLTLARRHSKRFAVIDGTQTPDEVAQLIQEKVKSRLKRRKLWKGL